MEAPEIVSQVAHLLRQRGAWNKDLNKDYKVRQEPVVPKDEVELTETGAHYAQAAGAQSEYDKEQAMKVERLKALVQSGNYHMDQDMVEAIAGNIAKMFM